MILRVSVAAALAADVARLIDPLAPAWLVLGVAALTSLGLFTPIVAGVCVAIEIMHLLSSAPFDLIIAIGIANAATLALLGPGAYSLDALRFGRRVL